MEPDELLIKHAQKGNPEAFRKIVEKYQAFVFTICFHITRDRQEAENLAQETFIQVYRSLPSYQAKGFKTWIGRIATNKSIDWKRKAKTQKQQQVVYLDEIQSLQEPVEEGMDDQLVKKENKKKVQELFEQLPLKYSTVLKKYYMQSKSYKQISDEEGIGIKAVESRLYRAKKILREKWKEDEPYESFE